MARKIEIQEFGLWEKVIARGTPMSFDIEITARCNNNCRHCYINQPAGDEVAKKKELTLEEITEIGRQAVDLGVVWCLISGGEPMLRPDFPEIYLALRKQGLVVSVFTNATLVSEKHIELFKKYPPRDIEITVYGVTAETYERISRVSGSFERFERGLNLLMDSGINVRLKSIIMQSNLHEQEAIAEFCRARTKDFYRFDPQLHLRFDRDPKRNEEIKSERLSPEQIVALEKSDPDRLDYLKDHCETLINEAYTHYGCDHLFHCGAGQGSFTVSFDGKFRLCSSLYVEETMYDLRQGTLADAYFNFIPRVRDMRSESQEFRETCRRCELINLCLWCPAHAYLETGHMDGKTPYFCEVAHLRQKHLENLLPDNVAPLKPSAMGQCDQELSDREDD